VADLDVSSESAVVIQEVSGEKRILRLIGRALPYQGVAFPGEQRAEFTWYPGNPEGSAQVLGAKEGETVFVGKWKNRFVGVISSAQIYPATLTDGTGAERPLTTAAEIVDIANDFRRKGQYCRVKWGGEFRDDGVVSGSVQVREGIMTSFVPKWDRIQDSDWEMRFQWTSQGDTAGAPLFQVQDDVSQLHGDWRSKLDDLLGVLQDDDGLTPIERLGDAIDSQVAKVATGINEVFDATSRLVDSIIEPADAARRLISSFKQIKEQAENLADVAESETEWEFDQIGNAFSLDDTPADLNQFPGGLGQQPATNPAPQVAPGANTPDIDFGRVVAAALYQRELKAQALVTARAAANARASTLRRVEPLLLGLFTARDDADLRDVSTYYYGTPDHWRDLADFNNIPTSKLSAGMVVFVPFLRQQSQQSTTEQGL
jgi:hypothetical protein